MEIQAFISCLKELREGRPCALATVLRQDGSVPRGAGATMAVLENGRTVGTVGGGALEYQAAERCQACVKEGRSALLEYGLAPNGDGALNMVCGGNVTVLCHVLKPEDEKSLSALQAMETAEGKDGSLWLARRLTATGQVTAMGLYTARGPLTEPCLTPEQAGLCRRQAALLKGPEMVFVQPLRLAGHAYIFGGGHVAQKLAPLLKELDFSPVVFEDRPEFATPTLFPQADAILLGDFADLGASIALTEEDAAVIMTRGHAYDNLLLAQVLRSPVWYVGLMGSRSKIAATKAYLAGEGLGETDIARVHMPVGLVLGGETPAEIAVSVAGEMVLCRARRNHSRKLEKD